MPRKKIPFVIGWKPSKIQLKAINAICYLLEIPTPAKTQRSYFAAQDFIRDNLVAALKCGMNLDEAYFRSQFVAAMDRSRNRELDYIIEEAQFTSHFDASQGG